MIITPLFQFCHRQNFLLAFQRGGRYARRLFWYSCPHLLRWGTFYCLVIAFLYALCYNHSSDRISFMHSGTGWSPVPRRSAYVEPKEGVAQNVQHPLFILLFNPIIFQQRLCTLVAGALPFHLPYFTEHLSQHRQSRAISC